MGRSKRPKKIEDEVTQLIHDTPDISIKELASLVNKKFSTHYSEKTYERIKKESKPIKHLD